MGFKDLFFKKTEEEKPKAEETTASNENVSTPEVKASTHPVVTPIGGANPIVGAGVVDPKYIEILGDKLDSLNMDGEDYLELKEALDSLLKVPGMNENTAFISAFTTLQTKGLTKERCIESIEYYVEELNKEKELFRQAQSTKYDENVASIDTEINDLNTDNEEAQAEIQRLTEQIEQNNATIAEKTTTMNANKAELEQEQANFDATLSHFVTALETDKGKIEQYLGSTTNSPEKA